MATAIRGNRRYIISQTTKRHSSCRRMEVEEEGGDNLFSVDTLFLRKLIKSSDASLAEALEVGDGTNTNNNTSANTFGYGRGGKILDHGDASDEESFGNDENKVESGRISSIQPTAPLSARPSRRERAKKVTYTLMGMFLMYLLLNIWEIQKTNQFWKSYSSMLEESVVNTKQQRISPLHMKTQFINNNNNNNNYHHHTYSSVPKEMKTQLEFHQQPPFTQQQSQQRPVFQSPIFPQQHLLHPMQGEAHLQKHQHRPQQDMQTNRFPEDVQHQHRQPQPEHAQQTTTTTPLVGGLTPEQRSIQQANQQFLLQKLGQTEHQTPSSPTKHSLQKLELSTYDNTDPYPQTPTRSFSQQQQDETVQESAPSRSWAQLHDQRSLKTIYDTTDAVSQSTFINHGGYSDGEQLAANQQSRKENIHDGDSTGDDGGDDYQQIKNEELRSSHTESTKQNRKPIKKKKKSKMKNESIEHDSGDALMANTNGRSMSSETQLDGANDKDRSNNDQKSGVPKRNIISYDDKSDSYDNSIANNYGSSNSRNRHADSNFVVGAYFPLGRSNDKTITVEDSRFSLDAKPRPSHHSSVDRDDIREAESKQDNSFYKSLRHRLSTGWDAVSSSGSNLRIDDGHKAESDIKKLRIDANADTDPSLTFLHRGDSDSNPNENEGGDDNSRKRNRQDKWPGIRYADTTNENGQHVRKTTGNDPFDGNPFVD